MLFEQLFMLAYVSELLFSMAGEDDGELKTEDSSLTLVENLWWELLCCFQVEVKFGLPACSANRAIVQLSPGCTALAVIPQDLVTATVACFPTSSCDVETGSEKKSRGIEKKASA